MPLVVAIVCGLQRDFLVLMVPKTSSQRMLTSAPLPVLILVLRRSTGSYIRNTRT